MKKYIVIIVLMVSVFFAYNYFADTEYYIPKPKAKLKIDLPLSSTSIYKTDIFIFEYSNSAVSAGYVATPYNRLHNSFWAIQ